MTWDASYCFEQSWLFWFHLRFGLNIVMDKHTAERRAADAFWVPVSFIWNPSNLPSDGKRLIFLPVLLFVSSFPQWMLLKGKGNFCQLFLRLGPFVSSVFVAPGGFIWMLLVSSAKIPTFDHSRWIYRHSGPRKKTASLCITAGKQHAHVICRSFICLQIQILELCFCAISVSSIRHNWRAIYETTARFLGTTAAMADYCATHVLWTAKFAGAPPTKWEFAASVLCPADTRLFG